MTRKPKCAWCRTLVPQKWGAINRALKLGAPIYCDRVCAGLGRRKNLTAAEKKEAKRLYDIDYRARNLKKIKAGKRAHHKKTYDPKAAAVVRKKRMPLHLEYCRRPEYKEYKQAYDQSYRAKKVYGPFAEAFLAQVDLDREIKDRVTGHEIRTANGTLNKKKERSRDANLNG